MFFSQKPKIVQIGDGLQTGKYKPHSCFSKVVNLKNQEGNFCFVTNNAENIAPNGIFIEACPVEKIKSIEISDIDLIVNDDVFPFKEILVYESGIDLNLINTIVFEQRLKTIPENHLALFPENSLIFLLNRENLTFFNSSFEKAFAQNALTAAELIISGKIVDGIKKIKGTGFGLTPSGDDFIAGFLFGLHFNQKKTHKNISSLINEIYITAVGNNELVNSFLFFAKNERYFFRLKYFVILLSGENNLNISQALNMLFSMGATSGADFLTGYIFAIKHSIEI